LVGVRGKYAPNGSYNKFDIVQRSGGSWIAVKDNPGARELTDDWLLLAAKGDRSDVGPRGHRGVQGKAEEPVTIRSWLIDKDAPGPVRF
jgi:hypothetical protein